MTKPEPSAPPYYVAKRHPVVIMDDPIEQKNNIGAGTRIWHQAHIRRTAKIGKECNIGERVYVDMGVTIGDRCKIQNGVNIYQGVHIGNGCFIGPNVQFTNDRHPVAVNSKGEIVGTEDWTITETYVEDGANLGANSTIIAGIRIGKGATVGAGSVVTKDIPPGETWVGNPARPIKKD